MAQIVNHTTSKSENWGNVGVDMSNLSESAHDKIDESEPIVVTLYAKPKSDRPYLMLGKLKKGVYEESSYLSLRSYILFSDIGRAVWNAALGIDKNSTIKLVNASILEEDKSWQVMVKNQNLTILLSSVRIRPIGKYTSSFYISLDISGKPAPLIALVREMMGTLNRKPWVDQSGELDWKNFTKKTSMSRKEVIEQWVLFSASPELSLGYLEQVDEYVCPRCKKATQKEWKLCPYCGEALREY